MGFMRFMIGHQDTFASIIVELSLDLGHKLGWVDAGERGKWV